MLQLHYWQYRLLLLSIGDRATLPPWPVILHAATHSGRIPCPAACTVAVHKPGSGPELYPAQHCDLVLAAALPSPVCISSLPQEVMEMCDEQAELFDWFGWIASRLGELQNKPGQQGRGTTECVAPLVTAHIPLCTANFVGRSPGRAAWRLFVACAVVLRTAAPRAGLLPASCRWAVPCHAVLCCAVLCRVDGNVCRLQGREWCAAKGCHEEAVQWQFVLRVRGKDGQEHEGEEGGQ